MKWGRKHRSVTLRVESFGPSALPPADPEVSARLRAEYAAVLQTLETTQGDPGVFAPASGVQESDAVARALEVAGSLARHPIEDTPAAWSEGGASRTGQSAHGAVAGAGQGQAG